MLTPTELRPHTWYVVDHPDLGLVALRTLDHADPEHGRMLYHGTLCAGWAADLKVVRELDLAGLAMQAGYFVRDLAGLAAREATE